MNPKKTARVYSLADLYAGPGGLSLGFKWSGFFQPIVAVEHNEAVAETYEKNLNARVFRKDVGSIEPKELLKVAKERGFDGIDIVVGGPPCKAFTTANTGGTKWEKIRGKAKMGTVCEHPDWHNFWKVVDTLRPRAVIAENVMGFRSRNEVFSKFIRRLKISGYAVGYRKLNAKYFGVPQRRKRIFIAGMKNWTGDGEALLPKNPPEICAKMVDVRQSISDLPELSNASPAPCISTYRKGRPTSYQFLMRKNSKILYDHVVHRVHSTMAERFQYVPQGYNLRKAWVEGKIPESAMRSEYVVNGNVRKGFSEKTLRNMHSNIYRRLRWDDVSYTITHVRKTVLIHPLQNRLLSIRETARLQSFPDRFRFFGSLNQQYQQIADAVPPLLAEAVAKHVGELLMRIPRDRKSNDQKKPVICSRVYV